MDYNGIPLLSEEAGEVALQVGANDRETLSLDLRPPGFSVDGEEILIKTVNGTRKVIVYHTA